MTISIPDSLDEEAVNYFSGSDSIARLFGVFKDHVEPTVLFYVVTYSSLAFALLIPVAVLWRMSRDVVHAAERGKVVEFTHWHWLLTVLAVAACLPLGTFGHISPIQLGIVKAIQASSDLADKEAVFFGEKMSLAPSAGAEPPLYGVNHAVGQALQSLVCQAEYRPHNGQMGLHRIDDTKYVVGIDWRSDYIENCGTVTFTARTGTQEQALDGVKSAVLTLYSELAPVAQWIRDTGVPASESTYDDQAANLRDIRDRFEQNIRTATRQAAGATTGIQGWKQLGVIHRQVAQLDAAANASVQSALQPISFSMPVQPSQMIKNHYAAGGDNWKTIAFSFSQMEILTGKAFATRRETIASSGSVRKPVELNISAYCSITKCDIEATQQHVADWMVSSVLVDPPEDLEEKDPLVRLSRKGQRFGAAAETLYKSALAISLFNSVPVVGDAGQVVAEKLQGLADKLLLTRNALVDWMPLVPYTTYQLIIQAWYIATILAVFVPPLIAVIIAAGFYRIAWSGAGLVIFALALPHLAATGMPAALIVAREMFAEVNASFGLTSDIGKITGLWSAGAVIAGYVVTIGIVLVAAYMSVRVFISRSIGWITGGADTSDHRSEGESAGIHHSAGGHVPMNSGLAEGAGAGGAVGKFGSVVAKGGKKAVTKIRGHLG